MTKGYILFETIVASAMLVIILVSILPTINTLTTQNPFSYDTTASSYLVQGTEVTYNILMSNWSSYPNTKNYILSSSGSSTILEQNNTPESLEAGKFRRLVTISEICRDTTGTQTACSGSNIDPKSKLISVTISWEDKTGATKSKTSELLVYKHDAI